MWFASDTGGTFTDLVVEDEGKWSSYKAPTVAADPVRGVMDALQLAADDRGLSLDQLLGKGEVFIHATTHAINAVLTGNTARTALLTTAGHPDVLLLREGGRPDPFDFLTPFPDPYIPRRLVFEVDERIDADAAVFRALDEESFALTAAKLRDAEVEAVAVCLLWSVINPVHELRVGELLDKYLPGVPYTLSHRLNPAPREFRRASAAAIDASLKPMMTHYLGSLTNRLMDAGFGGRVLVVTSQGGVMDAAEVALAPIHVVNSGPSMAPVAGRAYVGLESDTPADVVIADTGGTTFDVSVVRDGRIPLTRELWIGTPIVGHLTGFPSVDVRSVGAGGGSLAAVDAGGVLHVGPQSAGAYPGPACYGRGGTKPTLTDAAVLLGYLDADYFLGGTMSLDVPAANAAMTILADELGMSVAQTAASVVELATETMTQAILDITVKQGIDPANAVLVGGGGAAGMNIVFIARRLGCKTVVIPETGATLSAAGALISNLTTDYRRTGYMALSQFSSERANVLIEGLETQCQHFADGPGAGALSVTYAYTAEARYADQAWEIEVELPTRRFNGPDDVAAFVNAFHREHERLYAFSDHGSDIEIVNWRVGVSCRLREPQPERLEMKAARDRPAAPRNIILPNGEAHEALVYDWSLLPEGMVLNGPAVVESPFTTVIIDKARFQRSAAGSLIIELEE
ncbi:hydantoinase/oxoprolinase family protein [Sphingobium boeckii]|uniref:N-methylhydantoinase A n=1 Tax=Sphingobium boeckii TaxID=1082345 RepID=A0A7W9AG28_9SPHN|nr:hydantoinase/oxoprolinase family protein [Sphingobium boeckii]MBB5684804.1 N-methylhydantoinase A [Sphingobium boeckii]